MAALRSAVRLTVAFLLSSALIYVSDRLYDLQRRNPGIPEQSLWNLDDVTLLYAVLWPLTIDLASWLVAMFFSADEDAIISVAVVNVAIGAIALISLGMAEAATLCTDQGKWYFAFRVIATVTGLTWGLGTLLITFMAYVPPFRSRAERAAEKLREYFRKRPAEETEDVASLVSDAELDEFTEPGILEDLDDETGILQLMSSERTEFSEEVSLI